MHSEDRVVWLDSGSSSIRIHIGIRMYVHSYHHVVWDCFFGSFLPRDMGWYRLTNPLQGGRHDTGIVGESTRPDKWRERPRVRLSHATRFPFISKHNLRTVFTYYRETHIRHNLHACIRIANVRIVDMLLFSWDIFMHAKKNYPFRTYITCAWLVSYMSQVLDQSCLDLIQRVEIGT